MYTGEKITLIADMVYNYAKKKLETSGLDASMAEFVMRDVHRRFTEEAYRTSLLHLLDSNTKPTHEETVEEAQKADKGAEK